MGLSGWEKVPRSDPYYRACVVTSTAGMAVAGDIIAPMAAPLTGGTSFLLVPAGAIMGFVGGYLACPYLAPILRSKIEQQLQLTDQEVRQAADAMARYSAVGDAGKAIKLLAFAKTQAASAKSPPRCENPPDVGRQILGALS
jgi:hypothetical protein